MVGFWVLIFMATQTWKGKYITEVLLYRISMAALDLYWFCTELVIECNDNYSFELLLWCNDILTWQMEGKRTCLWPFICIKCGFMVVVDIVEDKMKNFDISSINTKRKEIDISTMVLIVIAEDGNAAFLMWNRLHRKESHRVLLNLCFSFKLGWYFCFVSDYFGWWKKPVFMISLNNFETWWFIPIWSVNTVIFVIVPHEPRYLNMIRRVQITETNMRTNISL